MFTVLFTIASLGLSEHIAARLPKDPAMIYTVSFDHMGERVVLDWRDRRVLVPRVCRKSLPAERPLCQNAALGWLQSECGYYATKQDLQNRTTNLREAVCDAASEFGSYLQERH